MVILLLQLKEFENNWELSFVLFNGQQLGYFLVKPVSPKLNYLATNLLKITSNQTIREKGDILKKVSTVPDSMTSNWNIKIMNNRSSVLRAILEM